MIRLVVLLATLALSQAKDPLFKYGTGMNDTRTGPNDDDSSIKFTLARPMKYFTDAIVRDFYQNTNGVVSFLKPYSKYRSLTIPTQDAPAMVCVFWTDIDTRAGGENTNQMWARNHTTQDDLDLAEEIISNATDGNAKFVPESTAVITYNRVNPFSQNTTAENTFQLTLAWNDDESFAIMQYTKLKFFDADSSANFTIIGFNDRFAKQGYLIKNISSIDDMKFLLNSSAHEGTGLDTNTSVPGLYVYRISDNIDTSKEEVDSSDGGSGLLGLGGGIFGGGGIGAENGTVNVMDGFSESNPVGKLISSFTSFISDVSSGNWVQAFTDLFSLFGALGTIFGSEDGEDDSGGSVSNSTDSNSTDSNPTDSNAIDANATDSNSTDANSTDSNAIDANATDSNSTDSNATDTNATDSNSTNTTESE